MERLVCLSLALLVSQSLTADLPNQDETRKGPYILSKYAEIEQGSLVMEIPVLTTEYPESVEAHLVFINGWRVAMNYHFLDWYTFEENTYHVQITEEEAKKMVKDGKCKVGKEIKTHSDNDCWKNLDELPRNTEVSPPKEFDPDMVEAVAFKSSCKVTWNCNIHKMKLDLFAMTDDAMEYNLFVFGPDGKRIRMNGGRDIKTAKIKDATLVLNKVEKSRRKSNVTAICVKDKTVICHIKEKHSIIVEFFGPIATWRNRIFYNPLYDSRTPLVPDITYEVDSVPDGPVTKMDVRQIDEKIVYLSEKLVYDMHQIMKELVSLKNTMIEVVNSLSKIDEELIGKLTKIPMATKWLSYLTFVFEAKASTYLSHIQQNNTCVPLFTFSNGRWELNKRNKSCIEHFGNPLNLFKNYLNDMDVLKDAPLFLNISSENEGWKYIAGKSLMDLLSPHIKYKDHGSFLDDIFKGWDFKWLIQMLIIAVIVIVIIVLLCKMCR